MPKRIEPEVEREVRRLAAKGHGLREIGRILGCSRHAVTNTLWRGPKPLSPASWNPSPSRLSLCGREEIRVAIERGDSFTTIARRIGRAASTVSREVACNGGRDGYPAHVAHQAAHQRARRPKKPKLACPRLAAQVAEWLELWWLPEQIAERLRIEFPDDPMMRVSHEVPQLVQNQQARSLRGVARSVKAGAHPRRPRSAPVDDRRWRTRRRPTGTGPRTRWRRTRSPSRRRERSWPPQGVRRALTRLQLRQQQVLTAAWRRGRRRTRGSDVPDHEIEAPPDRLDTDEVTPESALHRFVQAAQRHLGPRGRAAAPWASRGRLHPLVRSAARRSAGLSSVPPAARSVVRRVIGSRGAPTDWPPSFFQQVLH